MNELAIIEPSIPAFSFNDIARIADAFAQSRMFGVSDPAAALSLCLLAQAEGQHPAIAFRDYSIIQGKPAKKAEAMQRDFMASGGKIKWIELSDICAKAEFSHPSGGTLVIDWTMERAKAAGIGGKDMWKKYPRQMLRSRTISEGVRSVCPMATSGMYVPEEVADFDDKTEIVNIETGEISERPKISGIVKIKQRLGEMMKAGDAATTADEFSALVKANKDDLKTIRDANHEWWTGDGEDFEGYGQWIDRRRIELSTEPVAESATYQLILSTLAECTTRPELESWTNKNMAVVDILADDERRKFEAIYESTEAALVAAANMSAG